MDSYSFVMIHNSSLIKLSTEEQNKIQEMIQAEGSKIRDLIKNWK